MKDKPWGGRFDEENDPVFETMNRSLDYDIRLFRQDIKLNKAYSKELSRIGIITESEYKKIEAGLNNLEKDIEKKGLSLFSSKIEDIHMGIEELLTEIAGDAAKKIHTGKSRNDQVATDVRLYLIDEVKNIIDLLKTFLGTIVNIAEKNIDIPMPGFTHLRQAQPVLLSHYMMSYFFSIQRDCERLIDSVKRISIMPLGSAALAGSAFPIDRNRLKKELGFKDISSNSMDGVLSRDFMLEFLSNIAILSLSLSRMAEDFIIFTNENFNFFELSDKITTGSSIMPNKKNPDSLELTRAKTGRIIGNFVGLFTVLKALPSTYNKDLQEDKEKLFDTVDTIKSILKVNIIVLQNLKINKESIKQSIDSMSFATELADYLTRKKIPFREAHHIVGNIVKDCTKNKIYLSSLSESVLVSKYHKGFEGIGDEWSNIANILNRRNIAGGTGPKSVKNQISQAKKLLKKLSLLKFY
jgi:argininosuccinate lyase